MKKPYYVYSTKSGLIEAAVKVIMEKSKLISAIVIMLVACLFVKSIHASMPAVAIDSTGGYSKLISSFSLGYVFTANSAITVTALGKFDISGNGLVSNALARLYNWDTGAEIVSITIPSSSPAELNGNINCHYASITPVNLSPGVTYLLAVEVAPNESIYGTAIAAWSSHISWLAGKATPVGSPTMPANATTTTFSISRTINDCYFGPNLKYEALLPIMTLSEPKTRAVFQRNSQNKALMPIQGSYLYFPEHIEARAVVMDGFEGTTTDWQVIDANPSGGNFASELPVASGGWYRIEVRAFYDTGYSSVVSVDKVGIGEVFITAGQSNSANHGNPVMTPTYDIVSAWTGSGNVWRHAYDPQPNADGTGGSPWSRLGDILVQRFGCPVGFMSNGVGSTRVDQWMPGSAYYPKIQASITAAGANGFRAILWHQGESDSLAKTSAATYASRLNSVIAQTRVDAGWDVPWGVSLASWHPYSNTAQEMQVREGQIQVIDDDPFVFEGADTDDFHNLGYLHDSVHFNATGLYEHALEWKRAILKYLFPCDFEPDNDVDLEDLGAFLSFWLSADCFDSANCDENDLQNDDRIDFEDFAICASYWNS